MDKGKRGCPGPTRGNPGPCEGTVICNGINGVGVTQGGNWRCHPFFTKNGDLFSHRDTK